MTTPMLPRIPFAFGSTSTVPFCAGRLGRAAGLGLLLLLAAVLLPSAWALRPSEHFLLGDLEKDPAMTPGHFADLFEDFDYEYFPYLLQPDDFLSRRSGNCKDYATMGSYILGRRHYRTRLIWVNLVGTRLGHVVCYVDDKRAYLDYNNRKYTFNLERSGPKIRDIAEKVADSFEQNWSTASEYTCSYDDLQAHFLRTVVKTDPPELDTARKPPPPTP